MTAEVLLQSPTSPPVEPPPVEPPPAEPVPTQPPAEPPPAEPTPTQTPAEQPPAEPTPTQTPAEAAPPATEEGQVDSTFQSPPVAADGPSADGSVIPAQIQPTPIPSSRSERRDNTATETNNGDSNLILDEVELIDTLVVSGAYIWLCCGIGLFLLIPLVFLLLQIRGQLKITKNE